MRQGSSIPALFSRTGERNSSNTTEIIDLSTPLSSSFSFSSSQLLSEVKTKVLSTEKTGSAKGRKLAKAVLKPNLTEPHPEIKGAKPAIWSAVEEALFRKLYFMSGRNFCMISRCIGTNKTCVDVWRYAYTTGKFLPVHFSLAPPRVSEPGRLLD